MDYVRCQVENKNGKKTVWIPEKVAKSGKTLKLGKEKVEVTKTYNSVKKDGK